MNRSPEHARMVAVMASVALNAPYKAVSVIEAIDTAERIVAAMGVMGYSFEGFEKPSFPANKPAPTGAQCGCPDCTAQRISHEPFWTLGASEPLSVQVMQKFFEFSFQAGYPTEFLDLLSITISKFREFQFTNKDRVRRPEGVPSK